MKEKFKRPAPKSKKQRNSSRGAVANNAQGHRKNNHGPVAKFKNERKFTQRDTASPRNGKHYNPKHAGSLHRQVIVKTVEVIVPASFNKKGKMIRPATPIKRQVKKIVNHTNNL